jgi:F-type H+-transporting ATPase subunit delta
VKDTTVAGRYAKALMIVTERRDETERALEDLKAIVELVRPGGRVGVLLDSPLVRLSDKRTALKHALEGKAVKSVALFLDLLLRKGRLALFEDIVHEFEALVELKQGIQRAQVVSAVPLQPQEIQRLHAELERTTGKRIKLEAAIDADLIAGALVRIGDRVIDRSARTLLESIERQLLEVSV